MNPVKTGALIREQRIENHLTEQELAEKAGNPRTMNVVLLGALIRAFGLTEVDWDQVLRENIPEKMLEVNLKALHLGMETAL